jgi:hypothetical protein
LAGRELFPNAVNGGSVVISVMVLMA